MPTGEKAHTPKDASLRVHTRLSPCVETQHSYIRAVPSISTFWKHGLLFNITLELCTKSIIFHVFDTPFKVLSDCRDGTNDAQPAKTSVWR